MERCLAVLGKPIPVRREPGGREKGRVVSDNVLGKRGESGPTENLARGTEALAQMPWLKWSKGIAKEMGRGNMRVRKKNILKT